jgi:hypothetical protein
MNNTRWETETPLIYWIAPVASLTPVSVTTFTLSGRATG